MDGDSGVVYPKFGDLKVDLDVGPCPFLYGFQLSSADGGFRGWCYK